MPWILTFLTFLIVVYFGGHLYILLHISSFLSGEPWKYGYYVFYAILAIWWIVARVLDNRDFPRWSDILLTIGSFALPWMFYSSIFLIVYDLCLLFASLFDVSYLLFSPAVRLGLFLGLHGFVFLWLIFGYVNARSPTIIPYSVVYNPEKKSSLKTVKIALLSDIHIGTLNQWNVLRNIVDRVNESWVDIVLLAGDIFDGRLDIVESRALHLPLWDLRAPMWVYGAYGNHEYYGDPVLAKHLLEEVGVVMLQDEWRVVDGLYILWRDDRSVHTMTGKNRREVVDLMSGNRDKLPTILIDHQPSHLEKAEEAWVALQVSGHTHNGQLWPLGLIAAFVFEKSLGYHRRWNTHYVVSAWAATWWFPIKTSAKSEIPLITFQY